MGDLENNSHIEVVDHASEDDQLAETIRGSLEKSVYGRAEGSNTGASGITGNDKSAEDAATHEDSNSAASGEITEHRDSSETESHADGNGSVTVSADSGAHTKDSKPADDAEIQEDDFRIVNVMAEILRQRNVPKTMERLGCCTCSRCKADVIAMTLSALPAKYCVTSGSNKSPLINFYDQRYNAEITSSIMRSCLMVKDHPRHSK